MDFPARRALALKLLNEGEGLTRKAGQFLGQVAVCAAPLTDKQLNWLADLADRNGLSEMMEPDHG